MIGDKSNDIDWIRNKMLERGIEIDNLEKLLTIAIESLEELRDVSFDSGEASRYARETLEDIKRVKDEQ